MAALSWGELASLGVTVRPLSRPVLTKWERAQFRATFTRTIGLLGRELRHLGASAVVVELDVPDRMIRHDGLPRADARPSSDAVAIAFDSRFGPLRYETGEYDDWRDNLRAIALAMEALRAVDRYGVSKRGQQYAGWRAIPERTGGGEAEIVKTHADARRFLDEHGGSFRAAAAKLHPDKPGGDATLFRAAMRARDLLGGDA